MNIFNKELMENPEKLNNFINEINMFLNLNLEMQTEYRSILFNYITKIIDLPVENMELEIKNANSILEFLRSLEDFLAIIKEDINSLKNMQEGISVNTLEELDVLFKNYTQLQKSILENNIKINKFLVEAAKFVPSLEPSLEPSMESDLSLDNETVVNMTDSDSQEENRVIAVDSSLIENTLIISEMSDKVLLPYTIVELNNILNDNNNNYSNYEEIINDIYTIPYSNYKNPVFSRFKEAFKLVRNKEHKSIKEAFDLGMELLFNYNLHPAIISACKNIDELDIYLSYLDTNEVDKFECFKIKYEIPPVIKK